MLLRQRNLQHQPVKGSNFNFNAEFITSGTDVNRMSMAAYVMGTI